jgi:AmiR/NasT family two-component response regulator
MPALAIADETIGALSLFRNHADDLAESDVNAAQYLADVTSIAILRYRAEIDLGALNHRPTHALNSRVAIEQAKGIVTERSGIEMEQAFLRLLIYSGNNGRRLAGIARDVVDRTPNPDSL